MTDGLFPTKTRLELLLAVEHGVVLFLPDEEHGDFATFDTTDAEIGVAARRVSSRIDELERAGWVHLHANGMTWLLTDLGRSILDGQR